MEAISVGLILLLVVVASSVVSRASPIPLPLPLVQIAMGAAVAFVFGFEIDLDPEVFFLLFIAPLLFLDGWRASREDLLRDRWTILALALGLVVFTVVGAGYFIHWMIPSMPLPVAFALAAILSPTDAVSLSAIAERVPLPRRLMRILQGEALLNDASGLVCMRFAVVAMLTGSFALTDAFVTFLWLAIAGMATGASLAILATLGKDWVSRRFGEVTGSQILISLLIPFGAYLLASRIGASGILAAVAAGLVMNQEERSGRVLAITRVRRSAVWDAFQFAGNGMIFVLLGEQLPNIADGAARVVREAGHFDVVWLALYVVVITLVLAALRFLWVWATLALILFRATKSGGTALKPGWRLISATSLGGVRGAITLAGVLTLPLTLYDGSPFPTRDLAIFLAAGVIMASIVAAQIGLPYLLDGLKLPPEPSRQRAEDRGRVAAAAAAKKALERSLLTMRDNRADAQLYMDAGARILDLYQQRIDARSKNGDDPDLASKNDRIERTMRLVGLSAERNELYRMSREGTLPEDVADDLVREVDLLEARFSGH